MQLSAMLALILGGLVGSPPMVAALGQGDAEAMYNAFNSAFLIKTGGDVFYKSALNNLKPDTTWAGSLDILGAEDAYERTGDPEKKTLVNDLLTTWLMNTPTPWSWDGWNDDIGWFTLALIRGHQMTGNPTFLDKAKYGFDYAFGRGWDTQYNGGGIWEENPEYTARENPPRKATKEALSNDSLGKVACMIYQSTHDESYLNKCQQIYDWVSKNIFNSTNGQVYTGIDQSGMVDTSDAVYNQGTFSDFANLLYEITGDSDFYNDAKLAIDHSRESLTANGIFSNAAGYLNTWADEMARGTGHFVRDNRLWGTYYSWMVQNADAIMTNRRTDLGITWNAWDQPTPTDNTQTANKFVSAMAWLQFTPATQPNDVGGIHVITNQKTGMAIDSAGIYGNGKNVVQWGKNSGLNQRWLLTPNSDLSWNIVNLSTWLSLDCPGGSNQDGIPMIQWQPSRDSNQRWLIDQQSDGTYKISNQASGKVLDGAASTNNGATLVQSSWNGNAEQRWILL
ncbi:hypothetical protein MMC09_000435 [Bachmanniomyces sp. S44760]|nr:hypothetical protein [Bachmanniomyces sp. S44760]